MKSQLKRKKVQITTLGRQIEIVEMSAATQIAVMDAHAAGEPAMKVAALTVASCVPEFAGTADDVMESLTLETLNELGTAIADLSGLAMAKNSEAGRAADLSLN